MADERKGDDNVNWVMALPLYQIIYNSGYHKSIGTLK